MNQMIVMPSNRFITVREIAKLAGVSTGTVSRALRERAGVSPETRRTIMNIAGELGYDISRLRKKRIRRIAFLLHYQQNINGNHLFYSRLLRSVEAACRKHGLLLSFIEVGQKDNIQERMRASACDAAICAGYFEPEVLKGLRGSGKPLVLIDMKLHGYSSVNPDNEAGAYEAIRHLLDIGRTRIGIITGPVNHVSVRERIRGYRKALFDYGILANPGYEVSIPHGVDLDQGATNAIRTLLDQCPTPDAVFCYNDATALSVMRACLAAGLKVPHDISIIGFDDMPEAMLGHRSLTTVRIGKEELGALGIELLLREDQVVPIEKVTPVRLVVRTSTVLDRWT